METLTGQLCWRLGYGLLGPSGCGKTTLLKCIVGQTKVDDGSVAVFGFRAGSKGSGIPGPRVGYMPQEIALSQDLKVGETLNFYGVLLGLTPSKIKSRSKFLTELLQLPASDRFIDTLSGGQQRRVSLALALIHDPELIILDEPTVGVDPLLRKSIWNHLFDLASNDKRTILITTHYIEEARMAHHVGMMLDGTIICDGSPDDIMQKHGCATLESVFLKLCVEREMGVQSDTNIGTADPIDNDTMSECPNEMALSTLDGNVECGVQFRTSVEEVSFLHKLKSFLEPPKMSRIRALTKCSLTKNYRHIGHVLIHAVIPFLALGTFHLALSGFPRNIAIGVFNQDEEDFGAVFLSHIDSNAVMLKTYTTYEEGHRAVRNGDTWGLLHIHSNFSTLLVNRFLHGEDMTHECSLINLAMDATCQPLSLVVTDALMDAFIKFAQRLTTRAGLDPNLISLPFEINYNIHERDVNGLMGFAISGLTLCGIYFVSTAVCVLTLFNDISSGQLSRNIVSGITCFEILLSSVATYSVSVLIQAVAYMVCAFVVLGFTCQGPVYVVVVLVFLHGICGVTFGLFVSTMCSSEYTAAMLAFGIFLPSICLSGTLWPIESIPPMFRNICLMIPQTYTATAMRSLLGQSWDLSYLSVGYAFLFNIMFIAAFLGVSTFLLQAKLRYGLLGPSGCGKTTLLRCIIGRLNLDKGLILTLGQTPGSPQSGIPGPRVGYMPQEEALDGVLTIKELFYYYGYISGVHRKEIKKKAKFLCNFLKLPSKNSQFSTLSGGQRRRVSFAVTLIHDAELYIFDEPTVGVDPILKQSIWDYLFQLVQRGDKTVIMTTHYIEEARGANFVGMMFDGQLLAEGSPEQLLRHFNRNTLEDVFLTVCQRQTRNGRKETIESERVEGVRNVTPLLETGETLDGGDGLDGVIFRAPELCAMQHGKRESVLLRKGISFSEFFPNIRWTKLNAIVRRNFIQIFRYPGLVLFIVLLPSIQVMVANFVIGRYILSIDVGVVNHDSGDLAQTFLSRLDSRLIEQVNFSRFDDALEAARNKRIAGVLSFEREFSSAFIDRFNKTPFVSRDVLHNSNINVSLDGSNFVFGESIRFVLMDTFRNFITDVLIANDLNPNMGTLPLVFDNPIYGKNDDQYISYIMPGFIIGASFFAQLGLSLIVLFLDREGGKLERIYAAGVTSFEVIIGFLVLQGVVLLAQIFTMLGLVLFILQYSNYGSLVLIIALVISQGICGITLGLAVASATDTFTSAAAVGVAIVITSAALGGFFWPMEAMSSVAKIACRLLPFALAADSLRHIMYRGWGLFHGDILFAFGVTFCWALAFLAVAFALVRLRKGK